MTAYQKLFILSLAASLSVAASGATTWAAEQYGDVNRTWAERSIRNVTHRHIMSGYNDGMFYPEAWVSRTEFSQMTAKAIKLKPQDVEKVPVLQSVNQNAWSFQPVQEQPATSAYPPGMTPPENPLRRVEALAVAAGVLNEPLVTPKETDRILNRYADGDQVPANLRQAVATAIHYNIFAVEPDEQKFFGGKRIDPMRPITRAETAALLDKLYHNRDISIVHNGQIVAPAVAVSETAKEGQAISAAPSTGMGTPGEKKPRSVFGRMRHPAATAQAAPTEPSSMVSTGQPTGAQMQATQAPIGITQSQGVSAVREAQPEETGQATPTEPKTGMQAEPKTGMQSVTGEPTVSPELTNAGSAPAAANLDFYQGYGTPYRNSADTIPEFRTVNTTTTPATMDAAMIQPETIPINTTFTGTVAKALYTAFNTQGDPVMLILDHPLYSTNGHMIAPAGSKVLGLVTQVRSHNRTSKAAELGIAFNGLITPHGQRIPINAVVNNADGMLHAGELQGVVFQPNRSITALRREINTSEGGMYGTKIGKAYVLQEPLVNQVSDKPLDPMDVKSKEEIVLGVGDRLQLRSVEGQTAVTPPPEPPASSDPCAKKHSRPKKM